MRQQGLAALALIALASACRDSPDPGAAPRPDPPADATQEDDSDQPIRLAYVCGNQFFVTNAYSVPVSLTFRVSGTDEEGTAEIAAAPNEDPAFSEQLIETRNRGTLELYFQGRKLRDRENAGTPLHPVHPGAFLPHDRFGQRRAVERAVHLARRGGASQPAAGREGAILGPRRGAAVVGSSHRSVHRCSQPRGAVLQRAFTVERRRHAGDRRPHQRRPRTSQRHAVQSDGGKLVQRSADAARALVSHQHHDVRRPATLLEP